MRVERLFTRRTALLASAVVLFTLFALSGWAWSAIEADRIPVHWDINGQADGYGGKFEGLMVLPLVAVGLVALFAVIPLIEPRRANLAGSMRAFVLVWLALLAFLVLMHVAILFAAFGHDVDMATVVAGGLGLVFAVIGAVLGSVRSNFMFGVRTPWTLSSERSWRQTHRLAGRLFVGTGLATVAAGAIGVFADVRWLPLTVLLAGSLVAALASVVYSYLVWRGDPDRSRSGA